MAKSSKVDSDAKVMDVSKPGKGKIVANSRPIVAPIATDNVKIAVDNNPTVPDAEPAAPLVSTPTHRVIQPLTESEKTPEEMAVEVKTVPKSEPEAEITATPNEDTAEDTLLKEVSEVTAEEEKPAEAINNEQAPAETQPAEAEASAPESAPAETLAENAKPEIASADTNPDDSSESSDAAGVDAVADSVKSKKEAAQKAEEQAKHDAELQGLIESKKYIVPINVEGGGKSPRHHNSLWLIPVLILIVVAVAGYLVVDAGIVKTSINLPVDLIK